MSEPVEGSAFESCLLAHTIPQRAVIEWLLVAVTAEDKGIGRPSTQPLQLVEAAIGKRGDVWSAVLGNGYTGRSCLYVDVFPAESQEVAHAEARMKTKDYQCR